MKGIGLGFRVKSLGFRVYGLGFRVQDSGRGSGFGVWVLRFWDQGLGLGCRVSGG